MRAALHTGAFRLDLIEKPIPDLLDGEALLKVRACGFCGSDKHDLETPARNPNTPGHEFSGVVEKTLGDPRGFQPGDRVVVAPIIECGTCHYCQAGSPQFCENIRVYGCRGNQPPGGFAEYAKVFTRHLHRVPGNVPFESAALADPLAVAVHALDLAPRVKGERVAVFGAGAIGLLAAQVARLRGAEKVFLIDVVPEHLRIASGLGPYETVLAGAGEDHLGELVRARIGLSLELAGGEAPTLDHAIRVTCKGGTVLLVSQRPHGARIDYQRVIFSEIRLQGVFGQTRGSFAEALDLIFQERIAVRPVITGTFPLDRVQDALLEAMRPESLKVVVKPE